mmetsp:Transcript_56510/g.143206  ORF Transcript_56510/g.143206 Transcript_56510/m.143206 type:complete len:249 (-) Transcript_56510:430-1176(-)
MAYRPSPRPRRLRSAVAPRQALAPPRPRLAPRAAPARAAPRTPPAPGRARRRPGQRRSFQGCRSRTRCRSPTPPLQAVHQRHRCDCCLCRRPARPAAWRSPPPNAWPGPPSPAASSPMPACSSHRSSCRDWWTRTETQRPCAAPPRGLRSRAVAAPLGPAQPQLWRPPRTSQRPRLRRPRCAVTRPRRRPLQPRSPRKNSRRGGRAPRSEACRKPKRSELPPHFSRGALQRPRLRHRPTRRRAKPLRR